MLVGRRLLRKRSERSSTNGSLRIPIGDSVPIVTSEMIEANPEPDSVGVVVRDVRVRPAIVSSLARRRYLLVSMGAVAVVVGSWQLLASLHVLNVDFTGSPADVVTSAQRLNKAGQLGSAVESSVILYVVSVGVSLIIAIPVGLAAGWWRLIGAIIDPFVSVLYATPLVALLPLILEWFGITFTSQVVVVVLVAVFPLLVACLTGARHVDPALIRMARSFRASDFLIMRRIVVPSTVPYIVAGLRVSMGLGLVGVVVAEYFEGNNGIGGMILVAGSALDTGEVLVGILILAAISVFMTTVVKMVDRRVSRWQ